MSFLNNTVSLSLSKAKKYRNRLQQAQADGVHIYKHFINEHLQMRNKWRIFIWLCLVSTQSDAQVADFGFSARIDPVHKSGYYNIALSKEIVLHLKTDYSDLRIVNAGKAVAFAFNPESDVMRETYLRQMKYTLTEDDQNRTVIIAAADAFVNITHNLLLSITTIQPERKCLLSGSDDQQKWEPIGDTMLMSPYPGLKGSTGEVRIGFPASSFHYFRLTIINQQLEPFHITKVSSAIPDEGYTNYDFQEVRMLQNPLVRMTQKDSGNITHLKVRQPENYRFDRICYQLTGPKYFNRKAEIYLPVNGVQSTSFPGKKYASFSIIDNAGFNTKIPVSDTRDFMILVYNENDTPFHFTSVTTAWNQRFITAYLDSGKQYELLLGNSGVDQSSEAKPGDSIVPATLPFLQTGKITALRADVKKQTAETFKWLQWLLVSAGITVAVFAGYKFFSSINKSKHHDHI